MRQRLIKNVLLPVHEHLRGRNTFAELGVLESDQALSSDELTKESWRRCRKLLEHAYGQVPFWRERFTSLKLTPEDFSSFADLGQLPPMTKDDVREFLDSMVAPDYRNRMVINHTGGSTGFPLKFYCSREREMMQNAAKIRSRRWWGWDIGEPGLDLWGQPLALTTREKARRLKDRLLNQRYLSAFSMSRHDMEAYLRIIDEYRPALIYGYATALYQLALLMVENPKLRPAVPPKVIITTAETLYDYQRDTISSAFGAPVAEEYGAHDGGLMAHRCPSGGYHILSDMVHLEIDGDGDEGEALVTNFYSFGMPFIRYRIGDRIALSHEKCSCSLPFPLLKEVKGREYDMVFTTTGKRIHGAFFHYIFKANPDVKQFQVVQETLDDLRIVLVTKNGLPLKEENQVSARLHEEFGAGTKIAFVYTDAIAPEKSGKYRWVVSKVDGNSSR